MPAHDGATGGLLDDVPATETASAVVGAHGSLEGRPAVRRVGEVEELLLGDALTARLQGVGFVLPGLGFDAHLPLRLSGASDLDAGGTAFGDARLRAWVRPTEGPIRTGLGLGAWLPTGQPARTAGTGRVVPTATGSVVAVRGPLQAGGSVTLEAEGAPTPADAVGGAVLRGGAGAHVVLDGGSVGGSVRGSRPLQADIVERRGSTTEVAADATVHLSEGARLVGLAGLAPSSGVGASWRASLGLSVELGGAPEPVVEPVVVLPDRTLRVTDPAGRPVAAAMLAGPEGRFAADADGRLVVPGDATGQVSARGLGAAVLQAEGDVVLPWGTVPLTLTVRSSDGQPVAPVVTLTDPEGASQEIPVARRPELGPGGWSLSVRAPGYGSQVRTIEVPERAVEPVNVEVVLLPRRGESTIELGVTDVDGQGIRGAEVRLDGVSVGTSGGQQLAVEGLAAGKISVDVDGTGLRDASSEAVLVDDGVAEVDVALGYARGSVRLSAEGPSGPLTDAMVFVDGPRSLPPVGLGDEGRALLTLGPGEWVIALSSPAHGLQERLLVVDDDSPVPVDVAFVMLPDENGASELWVGVRDVSGDPVADAEVLVDGRVVGRTSTGGQLRLGDLQPRAVTVAARGHGLVPTEETVELRSGIHRAEMVMAWKAGTLQVAALDRVGPVDALVSFEGPAPYEGGLLGPPGRRTFVDMPGGEWEVLATHEAGMQAAWTLVADRPGRRAEVLLRVDEAAGDGVLAVQVHDPEGRPVDDAVIVLDGRPLVSTGGGGAVRVQGLVEGARELLVQHPTFSDARRDVTVGTSTDPVDVELSWAPGVVDVIARAGDAPAHDGMLYASTAEHELDSLPLDAEGTRRVVLSPGTWELVVSGREGMASTTVEVPPTPRPPTAVTIDLLPRSGALLHVVDQRGRPVAGVELTHGMQVVATSDASGLAVIDVPATGIRLGIRHPHIVPALRGVALTRDDDERWVEVVLSDQPVAVRLTHDGAPVSGLLSAYGPARTEPTQVDGRTVLQLAPGSWELVVDPDGDSLGSMRTSIEVVAGEAPPEVVFELMPARVRATADGLDVQAVLFEVGSATPTAEYLEVLEEVAAAIIGDPSLRRVEVQGHTDPTGDLAYNYELSRERARAVLDALVERGVPPALLGARGYGPSQPLADNATEEGRRRNRRVVFVVERAEEGADEGR